jgi:uncharacterized membrane protein YkvA (DUF1232 family)
MPPLCTEPPKQAVNSLQELGPKTAALASPENSSIQTQEQMFAVDVSSGTQDVKQEGLTDWLRRNMVALVRDVVFLYRLLRHADTPWYARCLLFFPVMYLCSPVQLMPNFIPVVGQMDDVFVIWITKRFVVKLIDQKTCQECQELAAAAELPFSQQLANVRR